MPEAIMNDKKQKHANNSSDEGGGSMSSHAVRTTPMPESCLMVYNIRSFRCHNSAPILT